MFVKHSEFGYGEILPTTEVVEEEVVVSVDVMFEHGVERNVSTYDLEDLSEEELQELSKQTLGSYIKKASNDAAFKAYGAGSASGRVGGKFNKSEYDKKVEAEGNADRQKAVKRISGIKTATDKLVREDYQAPENVIKQILEAKIDVRGEAQIADFKSRL